MSTTLPKTGLKLPVGTDIFNRAAYNENIQRIEDLTKTLYPTATTANMTLYVRTDGSDTNDGSANDAAHAIKSIQSAIDRLPQIINHAVTINVAAGTYTEDMVILGRVGSGYIQINGASTKVQTHKVNSVYIARTGIRIDVYGITAISTMTRGFWCATTNIVDFINCTSAPASSAAQIGFFASDGSRACLDNCEVTSNMGYGVYATSNSTITLCTNASIIASYIEGLHSDLGSIICAAVNPTNIAPTKTSSVSGLIINADGTLGGAVGSSMMGTGTLIPGTTGSLAVTMDGSYKLLTPQGNCVLNASGGYVGQTCSIAIAANYATSYTITFGANFTTQGVLATGTVMGKAFSVNFICTSAGKWLETGRTVAM